MRWDICRWFGAEYIVFYLSTVYNWRSWVRHCSTSRKVAGSIPYGVTGIFTVT